MGPEDAIFTGEITEETIVIATATGVAVVCLFNFVTDSVTQALGDDFVPTGGFCAAPELGNGLVFSRARDLAKAGIIAGGLIVADPVDENSLPGLFESPTITIPKEEEDAEKGKRGKSKPKSPKPPPPRKERPKPQNPRPQVEGINRPEVPR